MFISNSLEVNLHSQDYDMDNSSIDNFLDESRIPVKQQILDAFENFDQEYISLIEESTIYSQFYYKTKFFEKNLSNKRFCSFCFIKKVIIILILFSSLIELIIAANAKNV